MATIGGVYLSERAEKDVKRRFAKWKGYALYGINWDVGMAVKFESENIWKLRQKGKIPLPTEIKQNAK